MADGQWAPVGAMWVESDANLPGGEALARQIVHGKRFFLEELRRRHRGVWLPDSFGYNAAFPQLAKLAGTKWFLTQKLSWNQVNKMPHHTFWWEGIDGTRVFTHFPPVDTYNAQFTATELAHAERNFADKGPATRSLAPFGYGDGGGGPTREMMEQARRLASLEGSADRRDPATFGVLHRRPSGSTGPTRRCGRRAVSGTAPRHVHHPGPTKQGNRRSEHLLREAELWATAAALHAPGYAYPYDASTGSGRRCCCTSSTTSCPARRSPGCTARREASTRGPAAELTELTAQAVAALARAPPCSASPTRAGRSRRAPGPPCAPRPRPPPAEAARPRASRGRARHRWAHAYARCRRRHRTR
ncbi:Alpha-mannosidase OS=Streptomyces antimycoticus OX=68175 GN=SSPO_029580 PE=3 SV=1 [Streptomyces antimycoticus]